MGRGFGGFGGRRWGGGPPDGGQQPQPNTPPAEAPKEQPKQPEGPNIGSITRGSPGFSANPDELKARPDENKMISFNFKGQTWPDVLEWLAEVSGMSLDWQELPNDHLNLTTRHPYTIDEARDMINGRLLDRGYTMLRNGDVLSVVNVKKLDPSEVPRVQPSELATREPHEYVRCSFPLDWLIADGVIEELNSMKSLNGKLTALKTTNRIEAMDAVINLEAIDRLLKEEHSDRGQDRLINEFKLKYTRANEIIQALYALLGMERPQQQSSTLSPEQLMLQNQQAMQQMQQAQQRQQMGLPPGGKAPIPIYLWVNPRENSILANAPPDKMATIAQAVKTMDVPPDGGRSVADTMQRVHAYRLVAIDPETVMKLLEEMGNLDPTTTLQIDKKNKALIATGSMADHMAIRMLVDKLDGSDRKFDVIQLRRLEADYVAGTIAFMMGAGGEKKQQQSYNPWGGYSSRSREQPEDDSKKFRVDADVEHNRLLMFANEMEMKEVRHLLEKLGEVPGPRGSTIRVLDTIPAEETDRLLEKLREAWPSLAPNRLIEPQTQRKPSRAPADTRQGDQTPAKETTAPPKAPHKSTVIRAPEASLDPQPESRDSRVAVKVRRQPLLKFAALTEESEKPSAAETPAETEAPTNANTEPAADPKQTEKNPNEEEVPEQAPSANRARPPVEQQKGEQRPGDQDRPEPDLQHPQHAPIRITRGPDGRLIISSPDTQALDLLEEIASQMIPPRRDFHIFKLRNRETYVSDVIKNLEEFFKETDKKDNNNNNRWFWYEPTQQSNSDDTRRLSKRRPLRFIGDYTTRSIMVTGADPSQLATIEELIDLFDPPESSVPRAVRKMKIFPIKYSKAKVIAEAVKDVYRDLLSASDKALASNNPNEKQGKATEMTYNYIYGGSSGSDKDRDAPIKFKGLLSLGIDETSNTIVVSASDVLIENIEIMIKELDEACKPSTTTVRVLKLDNNMDSGLLQQKLAKIFKQPAEPPANPQGQQNGQNQGQQQGKGQRGGQGNGGGE